jgi:hypothetical protein
MTDGETTISAVDPEFLLASMRVASVNLKGWAAEIDSIGVALKNGHITTGAACEWLDELGLLDHLPNDQRAAA